MQRMPSIDPECLSHSIRWYWLLKRVLVLINKLVTLDIKRMTVSLETCLKELLRFERVAP